MLQRLRNLQESDKGFTLIELLVVILIIAILAAIAIPVFLRQRERAYAGDVQLTLDSSATAAESYATARADSLGNAKPIGSYAGLTVVELQDQGLRFDPANQTVTVVTATDTAYCVQVTDTRLNGTGNEWNTGTFDSGVGSPQPGANC